MTEYILKIHTNRENFHLLNDILAIQPTKTLYDWEYSITEDNELYTKAIAYFMSIIEKNKISLKRINITSNDISVWLYKPYRGQCNIEFTPAEMDKLSKNGIALCISCWEKH